MSIATPSQDTLVESFDYQLDNSDFSVQFHKLHKDDPNLEYAMTPVFFRDGEEIGRFDTLWTDLQEDFAASKMAQLICNRFNDVLSDLGEGGGMSWSEELLFIFRTKVILAGGVLQVL